MHALNLPSANNDIGERSAVFENEDCVVAASIIWIGWASYAAVEFLIAIVLGARDTDWRGERLDVA